MMITTRTRTLALVLAAAVTMFVAAPAANAAVIFSDAALSQHTASTALNIQNDGTLVHAVYFGNNNKVAVGGTGWRWGADPAELVGAATVTVNGITFNKGTDGSALLPGSHLSAATGSLALSMENDGPANDYGMLIAAIAMGNANQPWTPNLDIPDLTVGNTYRLQLLTQVGGQGTGNYTGTVEGDAFSLTFPGSGGDRHNVLSAIWTATDGIANLVIDPSTAPKIHGYTLHDVTVAAAIPEPASFAIWSLTGLCLTGFGVYRRRRRN